MTGEADIRVRVLMVCLGNICRSTMAESLLRHLAVDAGFGAVIEVDSAGTGDWHIGAAPHEGTQGELRANGVDVGDGRARQVVATDLETFDYVIAMDATNLADLRSLAGNNLGDVHAELSLLLDHAGSAAVREVRDVPDPYLVGGFDRVYALVRDACDGLLDHIAGREGLTPRA